MRASIGAGDPGSTERLSRSSGSGASVWAVAGSRLRRALGRRSGWAAVALAVLGPLLALLTYFAILRRSEIAAGWLQALIIVDLIYLTLAIWLIGRQIARLVAARRKQSAGSKLHARMVTMFAGVAAAPALILTLFFILVIQRGFDSWFSDQVSSVVRNSQRVAQAYAAEHEAAIRNEARALANQIAVVGERVRGNVNDSRFRGYLERLTSQLPFSDVFIVSRLGDIVARGANSYIFSFTPPSSSLWIEAETGVVATVWDQDSNEIRALVRLQGFFDSYLYVSRPVSGSVLSSLETANRGVAAYNLLEQRRGVWTMRFAAVFLGFVFLILLAAIYLGLWFAERLSRPIGRLAHAAERVRAGDLEARVKEERGDDELALLSKAFNRMTSEVRRKQEALSIANRKSEERRLFSTAVLGGVSAGVVALDRDGRIGLMNRSAAELLALDPAEAAGARFVDAAPEFQTLIDEALTRATDMGARRDGPAREGLAARVVERPVRLVRENVERELLARVTRRWAAEAAELDAEEADRLSGFVLTLDDLTDLVQAQRLAAWGAVARRLALESKNPLTPIQLAAERLRRKYSDRFGADQDTFERYTETIIRQTGDIGRMVDAFVRFAKMPSPKMAKEKLDDLVREAVLLQEEARTHIAFRVEIDAAAGPFAVRADRGQLIQAFTNLLQNAADALGARLDADKAAGREGPPAEIRVSVTASDLFDGGLRVLVEDNGVGLPVKDRGRLLEPYVTTREKGAGLGLAIVSKIIEEHSGRFALGDARPFDDSGVVGAAAAVDLPRAGESESADAGSAKTKRAPDDASAADPAESAGETAARATAARKTAARKTAADETA